MQVKDQNRKQSIEDPKDKLSFLKRVQNAFHTLLGIKSKCKLLTLYKVPEEIGDTIDLWVFCIESKGFDLRKQAKGFLENEWMQIEDGDESSNFTIRSGEEIALEFNGNVKPKEGQNPVIKFLKNGSSFAHLQLHLVDSKNPRGYILMVRKDILIDWKILNWDYLVKKYEGKLYEKSICTCFRYLDTCLYSSKIFDDDPNSILISITSNQDIHERNYHNPQTIKVYRILKICFFFKYCSHISIFQISKFSFKTGIQINFVKRDYFVFTHTF